MNAATILDKDLDELYRDLSEAEKKGKRFERIRRNVAYILKTVAAGGSLFIATGLLPSWNQAAGVATLLAVFTDSISANYKRLLVEIEYGHACRALRNRVKGEFNRDVSELYDRKNLGDSSVDPLIENLKKKAHQMLTKGIDEINEKQRKSEIDALVAISLDDERAR